MSERAGTNPVASLRKNFFSVLGLDGFFLTGKKINSAKDLKKVAGKVRK